MITDESRCRLFFGSKFKNRNNRNFNADVFFDFRKTVMKINPQRCNLCTITHIFLNRHRRYISFFTTQQTHDQQHNDDNPAHNHRRATSQQTPSHHTTTHSAQQHRTTQNNTGTSQAHAQAQAHVHLQCSYRPTSFQVGGGLHKNT